MNSKYTTSIFVYENDGEDEHELPLLIKFDVTLASPEIHTFPNGDPGTPGDDGDIELYSITSTNPLFDEKKLSDDTKESLEEEVKNYLNDEEY